MMKQPIYATKFYLTSILIVLSILTLAQEQKNVENIVPKNEIKISGEISHLFHNFHDLHIITRVDDYRYINPKGIELTYFHSLKNDWKIGTSLFYNWSTFYTQIDKKYDCNEIGFSILFKKRFRTSDNQKYNWAFGFGTYNGIASNIEFYLHHREYWSRVYNSSLIPDDNFSENFFSDLYADIEWSKSVNKLGIISLLPFTKYRIIKNAINTKYTGLQLGLKLNYSFGF